MGRHGSEGHHDGDTLSDPSNQVVLESMTFPAPVINVAIEPKTKGDQEKLSTAIQRLAEEDPSPSRSAVTRRPVRRSSGAWASFTSRGGGGQAGARGGRGARRRARGARGVDKEVRKAMAWKTGPGGRGGGR
ncbi:hypothetical protein GCM10020220_109600 [Nonomuraea rubra]